MEESNQFKRVIAHAKEYGFVFPSSEIYDGLSAVYDYGPNGVELKNNIKEYWWKAMVEGYQEIVGIDSAIFMHPTTWKASGHIDAFNDPLIENKDSNKRYRADVLIENHIKKIEAKIQKEVFKATKKFGQQFDRSTFINNNQRVIGYQNKIKEIQKRFSSSMKRGDLSELRLLIEECGIACPDSGSKNWSDIKQFNLMFQTKLGAAQKSASDLYMRPETAQGIFLNYLNVQKTSRLKIPFGIAQIGKAFRNEIVARQFIFRMREFEQMEMQYFIPPGSQQEWYSFWKEARLKWHHAMGIDKENYRFHDHIHLAHYADDATDIEFKFPFGFKELEGIHSRTDFDLSSHQTFSGKKISYFDPFTNQTYTPFVIETSIGLDRMFLAIYSACLKEQTLEDASKRIVFELPSFLAPVKLAILPLVNKEALVRLAQEINDKLQWEWAISLDVKDTIGKRYRRQDAIGTPYCVTIDFDSLDDGKVTLRNRDSMKQERIAIDRIKQVVAHKVDMISALKTL
ncbi:MAG: glycine--tRNA ligase [Flavobacteriaceae bacterium]|nr:glycine--tRNA ligase [Flavobacteriaceae bacterium]